MPANEAVHLPGNINWLLLFFGGDSRGSRLKDGSLKKLQLKNLSPPDGLSTDYGT